MQAIGPMKLDLERIKATFAEVRREQAKNYPGGSKALTPFDEKVGEVVLRASLLAMEDVRLGCRRNAFKVVSAPTGSGKSTSAAAVAATLFRLDPSFSCAFVVETIRQADEVFKLVAQLLPEAVAQRQAVVWTSGHNHGVDIEAVHREHGCYPAATFLHDDLKAARIIVVTHKKWLAEIRNSRNGWGADAGVRRYKGRPRDLIFVDEHPELVKVVGRQPNDIVRFRDALFGTDPNHPWSRRWVPILECVHRRMEEVFKADGATYVPVELVTPEEGAEFRSVLAGELEQFVADVGSRMERRREAEDLEETARFLTAAAQGCVFVSRQEPRAFVAYELDFTPSPGHVLLDATADLTGMQVLMKGMEDVEVPGVDFSRLSITHVQPPREFTNVSKLVKKATTAQPYAAWIQRVVVENSEPGERVLVVAHKSLFDHAYLTHAEDPERPLDWAGRSVSTLHWGVGIGSNRYKHYRRVFLFGEFFVPKAKTIGQVLAYRQQRAADADLSGAIAGRMRGDFLTVHEGHLLRWAKQLACRGNVRNIDAEGRCGDMRLYLTMDFVRLTTHLHRLFPGAPTPRKLDYRPAAQRGNQKGDGRKHGRPQAALIDLLSTTGADILWSDEVERRTGVKAFQLARALESKGVAAVARLYGWSLKSAVELGQRGRRKALVREVLAVAAE